MTGPCLNTPFSWPGSRGGVRNRRAVVVLFRRFRESLGEGGRCSICAAAAFFSWPGGRESIMARWCVRNRRAVVLLFCQFRESLGEGGVCSICVAVGSGGTPQCFVMMCLATVWFVPCFLARFLVSDLFLWIFLLVQLV